MCEMRFINVLTFALKAHTQCQIDLRHLSPVEQNIERMLAKET
jgi:hypothetical protein